MLHAAQRVNGAILWANLHLLFWLSLVPFVTGWMGENHFARAADGASTAWCCCWPPSPTSSCSGRSSPAQGPDSPLAQAVGTRLEGQGVAAALRRRDPARVRRTVGSRARSTCWSRSSGSCPTGGSSGGSAAEQDAAVRRAAARHADARPSTPWRPDGRRRLDAPRDGRRRRPPLPGRALAGRPRRRRAGAAHGRPVAGLVTRRLASSRSSPIASRPATSCPYVLGGRDGVAAARRPPSTGPRSRVAWSADGARLLVLAADPGSYALDWAARAVTGADGVAPRVRRPGDAWRRLFLIDVASGAAGRSGRRGSSVWEVDWDGDAVWSALVSEDPTGNGWYGAAPRDAGPGGSHRADRLHRPRASARGRDAVARTPAAWRSSTATPATTACSTAAS